METLAYVSYPHNINTINFKNFANLSGTITIRRAKAVGEGLTDQDVF